VRAGNQKGRVERAIRYVRESFWAAATSLPWNNAIVRPSSGANQVAHQRPRPGEQYPHRGAGLPTKNKRAYLPLPLHPFNTDLILPIRSAKTIYVRFDLNDYSIPPEAVRRPLTLVASDTWIRILDRTQEIARHRRSYDRHQPLLDPAHQQALLQEKRKAFHSTPTGRLAQAVPESETLLDLALARGNRRAVKLPNCSNCWTSPALRPYAMPSKKHWSGRRPALLLWLSCCAGGSKPTPSARPRSISAATPKPASVKQKPRTRASIY